MSRPDAPPTILLVDDEPRILSSLQRTLRKQSYTLLTAPDAEAALTLLRARSDIRLVVSDQRMPGLSGAALLGEVARQWPQVARVLLTGWAGEIPEEDIEAAKLFALLAKPWDDSELKDTIASAVKD